MSQSPIAPSLAARGRFLAAAIGGAYVVLNGLLTAAAPLTAKWPVYAVTAVTVPPMVLVMIYVVIPLARRL
jgi:antibiotic biosynthesis monooxygenase (ABM) superfamily enzyme